MNNRSLPFNAHTVVHTYKFSGMPCVTQTQDSFFSSCSTSLDVSNPSFLYGGHHSESFLYH